MSQGTKLDQNELDEKYPSRREVRRARVAARRAERTQGGWGWLGGLLLIALGALFLLQNLGYVETFSNWWALFLLLPAAGTFSTAMGTYRKNGNTWTREALGPLFGTFLFLSLAVVFLFGLDLSFFGPLLLIAGGALLLFTATRR